MNTIIIVFFAAVALRLLSLVKSAYLSCLTESILNQRTANGITWIGAAIFVFSMIVLWTVIVSLKDIWTVKLYIAPYQVVNKHFIFKYFRHPNYFLNIIPELVAIALICQAWYTLTIGLPLYFIPLIIRIRQEEKVMKQHFNNY